jgi:hypothetical protein
MNEKEIAKGFQQLNELSLAEYREPIERLIQEPDPLHGALRLGRLIGVMLKEPFAESLSRQQPSFRTGAFREWHLLNQDVFEQKPATTWQFVALKELKAEIGKEDPRVANMTSVYAFAQDAHHETGFFGYFAQALKKYICGDKNTRAKIDVAIKEMKKVGVPQVSPESIVGAGGLSLGAYLIHVVPMLGFMGAPVIAAIVLILYTLGVDAFCNWAASLRTAAEEQQ